MYKRRCGCDFHTMEYEVFVLRREKVNAINWLTVSLARSFPICLRSSRGNVYQDPVLPVAVIYINRFFAFFVVTGSFNPACAVKSWFVCVILKRFHVPFHYPRILVTSLSRFLPHRRLFGVIFAYSVLS